MMVRIASLGIAMMVRIANLDDGQNSKWDERMMVGWNSK